MPAKGLDTSVITFIAVSVVGFIIIIIRRLVLKGELGGSSAGRYGSAFVFILLWLIYIIIAALSVYDVLTPSTGEAVIDATANVL